MKSNNFSNRFFRNTGLLGLLSMFLISCGTYQSVRYDDGIYDDGSFERRESNRKIVVIDNTKDYNNYEDNYFSRRLTELESIDNDEIFTDVENYNSYDTIYNPNFDTNPGWGNGNEHTVVNINLTPDPFWYGNAFGPWNWGFYDWGWNNWGWNSWAWSPWRARNWGFVNPYWGWGWNSWAWNPWRWNRWGWNNWGWSNWNWNNNFYRNRYYGRRDYTNINTRRYGSITTRNRFINSNRRSNTIIRGNSNTIRRNGSVVVPNRRNGNSTIRGNSNTIRRGNSNNNSSTRRGSSTRRNNSSYRPSRSTSSNRSSSSRSSSRSTRSSSRRGN